LFLNVGKNPEIRSCQVLGYLVGDNRKMGKDYYRTQINNITVIYIGSNRGSLLRKCNISDTTNIDFRRTAYSSATVIWNIFAFGRYLRAFRIRMVFRMMEFLKGIIDTNNNSIIQLINQSINPLNTIQSHYYPCSLGIALYWYRGIGTQKRSRKRDKNKFF
jgi:hypothetical protein